MKVTILCKQLMDLVFDLCLMVLRILALALVHRGQTLATASSAENSRLNLVFFLCRRWCLFSMRAKHLTLLSLHFERSASFCLSEQVA